MPRGRKPVNMPLNVSAEVLKSNLEIVNSLHQKKMRTWRTRPLARPTRYLATMQSAVKKLSVCLKTSDLDTLRCDLEDREMAPSTRFWVVTQINEVLFYLEKPRLDNPRPEKDDEVSYVPIGDFLRKITKIKEDHALYLGALYATGCRYAELPKAQVKDDWVFIEKQLILDSRGKKMSWRTKNASKRHAAILPPLKSFIMAYKALPLAQQEDLCIRGYHRTYGAARRVLGANIHTLRHSYAIECIKRGKSVEEAASWIGDTSATTKKHYIGYIPPNKGPWGKD